MGQVRVTTQVKWENLGTPKTHKTDEYSHICHVVDIVMRREASAEGPQREATTFLDIVHSFLPSSLPTISDITYHVSSYPRHWGNR